MIISASSGSSCGAVNLCQLVDGIDLLDGKYILSMRERIILADEETANAKSKIFSLGKATGRVRPVGGAVVELIVESPDTQDYIDLYDAVCSYVGIEHEHLPRPKHRLDDLSFVRGIRNDLLALRRMIASRLRFSRKTVD